MSTSSSTVVVNADQLGVDECEINRITFRVALWALHRRRLDDALTNRARILDVLEFGGKHDGLDELGATVHFEQFHGGSDLSALPLSF